MSIEPVKIPQNVYIEDRIIGPLTLRQIIMMAIGAGISYMLYASYQKAAGTVGIPMTIALWTPAALSAAFALVNINDLSLTRICFLLAERLVKPASRTWAPREGISVTIHFSSAKKEETPKAEAAAEKSAQQQMTELATVVDRQPFSTRAADPTVAEPATVVTPPASSDATPSPELLQQDGDAPAETQERPRLPVDPSRIAVDGPHGADVPALSDLSVFRDIFPTHTS